MRYQSFTIQNFKGIAHARLDFSKPPIGRIATLVGLNESGKTTVLEAIDEWSTFREGPLATIPGGYPRQDRHDLIPISQRANFNGLIRIEAEVATTAEDRDTIRAELRKTHNLILSSFNNQFTINRSLQYIASRYAEKQPPVMWNIAPKAAPVGQKPVHVWSGEHWQTIHSVIGSRLPRIVYFPNFLFEFPDRIYLESAPTDEQRHSFYRGVIQDVLDAIGDGSNLETHILARAKSGAPADFRSLESVLLNIGAHITQTVFGSWERVFRRSPGQKEVVATSDRDGEGRWYLRIRIKDGSELYEISERSLGFRWFFAYLLLTQYRGFRGRGPKDVLFLLDEPASNLHPTAQSQLLESLTSLPETCSVIYTTHSQHMINPSWLENVWVVKNAALHYDGGDEETSSRRTNVTVTRYRKFAALHPDQTTYFRPILDMLDYRPSSLELAPNAVLVEGKNDWYGLQLALASTTPAVDMSLIPGGGAGSLDSLISLYLGWARAFVVLLDGDTEGERQRKRYLAKFGEGLARHFLTLADIDKSWRGKGLEGLFSDAEKRSIVAGVLDPEAPLTKASLWRAAQERVATRSPVVLELPTNQRFQALFGVLRKKLEGANDVSRSGS